MTHVWQAVLVAAAYVVGSMPWGYWLVRATHHVDIREHGSGNTGATNVWRTYGPRLGVPTLVLDMAKGLVPTALALALYGYGVAALVAAAAVLGHTFPVFLGLGGGKGVATGAGAVVVLCPLCFALAAAVFVAVLWLFRYVSLASIVAVGCFIMASLALGRPWPVVVFGIVGGAMVVGRHRANIGRLRAGTEPRVASFGRGR